MFKDLFFLFLSQRADSHKGVIVVKMTSEDIKVLRSFAVDGKFSSLTYNNIHDLLRGSIAPPTQSLMDEFPTMLNILIWIPTTICQSAVYIFQEIRFLLMVSLGSIVWLTRSIHKIPNTLHRKISRFPAS